MEHGAWRMERQKAISGQQSAVSNQRKAKGKRRKADGVFAFSRGEGMASESETVMDRTTNDDTRADIRLDCDDGLISRWWRIPEAVPVQDLTIRLASPHPVEASPRHPSPDGRGEPGKASGVEANRGLSMNRDVLNSRDSQSGRQARPQSRCPNCRVGT